MRNHVQLLSACICAALLAVPAAAQPPGGRPGNDRPREGGNASLVNRLMTFDKNGDGKLTKEEITDPRLMRLFEQADENKDGVVTKEELTTLAAKLEKEFGQGPAGGGPGAGGPGGRGPGGPGGQGGPGGRGPGGQGGPGGGRGGPGFGPGGGAGMQPPQPGQVLPSFVQESLKLTPQQKQAIDQLQKEVDARLEKILTAEQRQQMKEMRPPGPGGRGPGGGPPGGGPPVGGPPGGAS